MAMEPPLVFAIAPTVHVMSVEPSVLVVIDEGSGVDVVKIWPSGR